MEIWARTTEVFLGRPVEVKFTIPGADTLEEAANYLASTPWIKDDLNGIIYFTSYITAIGEMEA